MDKILTRKRTRANKINYSKILIFLHRAKQVNWLKQKNMNFIDSWTEKFDNKKGIRPLFLKHKAFFSIEQYKNSGIETAFRVKF